MTLTIIQARLASTRLPGKVLLPLAGKPVLQHVIERCREADLKPVVVCPLADGDALFSVCRAADALLLAVDAPPDDVFSRYRAAMDSLACVCVDDDGTATMLNEVFVRVTSDCPLVDPGILRMLVRELETNPGADYANARIRSGLPVGFGAEAVRTRAFMQIPEAELTAEEREHVLGYFIDRTPDRCIWPQPPADLERPYRLTLDTPADYEVLTAVFDALAVGGKAPDSRLVLAWLDEHPEVARLNTGGGTGP